MDKQEKIYQINYSAKNTIQSALGIEITDLGDNFICGKMPVDKRTKQQFGLLHGGGFCCFSGDIRQYWRYG